MTDRQRLDRAARLLHEVLDSRARARHGAARLVDLSPRQQLVEVIEARQDAWEALREILHAEGGNDGRE